MEIRQLRYFVAVAEDQHFRRASARLHVAQPAVSEQIRKLEAEVGVRLLDRTSRSVELTSAGAAFFEDAQRILHDVDHAGHSARRAAARGQWRVRLGFTLHALPPAIGTTLARLRTAGARVDVDLATAAARTLLQQVRDRQLDAAVVCLPAATAGLRAACCCRGATWILPATTRRSPPSTARASGSRWWSRPPRRWSSCCWRC
jgi:DNA-binding transcriptional LysR family regulator